ncbi:hypothetical protein BASA60_011320 [Batrachochytrium salamandrivorans]|nr:hypothetical protein BASA60_011320 [Batrachochytrium salamandrivorans]
MMVTMDWPVVGRAVVPIKKRRLEIAQDLQTKQNKRVCGTLLAISNIINPIVLAKSPSTQYETDARATSPCYDDATSLLSIQGLRRYNSDSIRNTRECKSTARTPFQNRRVSLSYTRRPTRANAVLSIEKAYRVNDSPSRTNAALEILPWGERKISLSFQHGIDTITTPIE